MQRAKSPGCGRAWLESGLYETGRVAGRGVRHRVAARYHSAMKFMQIDVFTSVPFRGNPVAVVLDACGLSTDEMQRIAAWTHLSETTFVCKPTLAGADYLLRIFTPTTELPFAGHPTIGSAHAVLETGMVKPVDGRFRQECGAGVLDLVVKGEGEAQTIWVRAPRPLVTPLGESYLDAMELALGGKVTGRAPLCVNVGPVWAVADLGSASAVAALRPDMAALATFSNDAVVTGVVAFGASDDGVSAIHVRAFAPAHGVPEDPVCGSGNVSVGIFLHRYDQLGRFGRSYRARQGMQLGRDGTVSIRVGEGGEIDLGGQAVTCIEGSLRVR